MPHIHVCAVNVAVTTLLACGLAMTNAHSAETTLDGSFAPQQDPAQLLGDPNRGPEPDPSKAKPLPPHQISWPVNQGHPLTDDGHFRLQGSVLRAAADVPRDQRQALIDQFTTTDWGDGSLLRVSLLLPPNRAQRPVDGWPLIIYCPGSGDVGRGRFKTWGQLDPALLWATPAYRERLPAVVMRMHPMKRTMQYGTGPLGEITMLPAFDAYLDAIDAVISQGDIDQNRISAYGFSMGGSTTWAMLRARPNFFAAVAPCAGAPITDPAAYPTLQNTAIWMFMGNQDPWQGSSKYIWAYQQLLANRHPRTRFWEMQDVAHAMTPNNLPSVAWWLWHQRKP